MVTNILRHTDIALWVQQYGVEQCIKDVFEQLRRDYARWQEFHKTPRHAVYFAEGPSSPCLGFGVR